MTDNEMDTLLREHAGAWRAANQHRPGVDWDAVTAPRRSRGWMAIAAVAVAAAAISVPLAVVAGDHTAKQVNPARPLPPKVARQGAPQHIVTLHDGAITFVGADLDDGVSPTGARYDGLGVSPDARVALGTYRLSGCRVKVDRVREEVRGGSPRLVLDSVGTVAGGPPTPSPDFLPTPMAVSPDGTLLAMVLMAPSAARTGGCGSLEEIAILNLADRSVVALRAGDRVEHLQSLSWSPDSRQLAFQVARDCGAEPTTSASCPIVSSLGTHLYTVGSPMHAIDRMMTVLPAQPRPTSETTYGPVFWWHAQLATFFDGRMLGLNGNGGTTGVLATGFPNKVFAVSSDPTGDHLLLSAPPTEVDDAVIGGHHHYRVTSNTYRWDRGVLALVPHPKIGSLDEPWAEPGW